MDLPTLTLPRPGRRLPLLAGLGGEWAHGPGSLLKIKASLLSPVHPPQSAGGEMGRGSWGYIRG